MMEEGADFHFFIFWGFMLENPHTNSKLPKEGSRTQHKIRLQNVHQSQNRGACLDQFFINFFLICIIYQTAVILSLRLFQIFSVSNLINNILGLSLLFFHNKRNVPEVILLAHFLNIRLCILQFPLHYKADKLLLNSQHDNYLR